MASSIIAIGSCSVEICGDIDYEKNGRKICFSIPGMGAIRVSAAGPSNPKVLDIARDSIVVLNPAAPDTLLEDVIQLYCGEFSIEDHAHIHGCTKDIQNLTLVVKEHEQAVAAMTYRIRFVDMVGACAVILLAAVQHSHQRKGVGSRLYAELKTRLCAIGVSTVYCWPGDSGESESFWTRQGFEVLGDGSTRPELPGRQVTLFPAEAKKIMIHKSVPQVQKLMDKSLKEWDHKTEPANLQECLPSNAMRADNAPSIQVPRITKRERDDDSDLLPPLSQPRKMNFPEYSSRNSRDSDKSPVVWFMNMANFQQKLQLSEFVESLGGRITDRGCMCTHVLTGEVRRTVNFCAALCVGAWIVSPEWLKASVREKKFVDPSPFILEDASFKSTYKTDIGSVVKRARTKPLFQGFYAYITLQIGSLRNTVDELIKSGGGKVVLGTDELTGRQSTSFIISCKGDTTEARRKAVKAGLRVLDVDWLLRSIMRQELDFNYAFAEGN